MGETRCLLEVEYVGRSHITPYPTQQQTNTKTKNLHYPLSLFLLSSSKFKEVGNFVCYFCSSPKWRV
nr:hypothetical protein CFP56_18137 [Quercus suber]